MTQASFEPATHLWNHVKPTAPKTFDNRLPKLMSLWNHVKLTAPKTIINVFTISLVLWNHVKLTAPKTEIRYKNS